MYAWISLGINRSWLTGKWKERKQRENNWQRRANIHCAEVHFRGNKKKRRNRVTRNTGSDTVKDKGKGKTKENTRGRGSLCFIKAWQSITQSKICVREDRGAQRSNDKVICNREYVKPCWAWLGSSLCGLASPVTASDHVRHAIDRRVGKAATFKRLMPVYLLTVW